MCENPNNKHLCVLSRVVQIGYHGSGSASNDSMSDYVFVYVRRELKFTKKNKMNLMSMNLYECMYICTVHTDVYEAKAREHPAEEPKPSHLLNENVSIVWVNVVATYVSSHIYICMCIDVCLCMRMESGQTKTSSSS